MIRPRHLPAFVCAACAGLVLLPACSARTARRKTAVPPRPGGGEKGPLPPLKLISRFEKELGKKTYPAAEAPAKPPLLRWDFSAARTFAYDYTQRIEGTTQMGEMSPELGNADMSQKVEGTGKVLVKSRGGGTADKVTKDLVLKTTMLFPGMDNPRTMEQAAPPVVVQGVAEDSSVSGSAGQGLDAVFSPLPPKALEVGERAKVPSRMPFNAMGSSLWVRGSTTLLLKGYVTIEGHLCAQLDLDIDVSKLDVPEEMEGTYKCSARGKGRVYFDTVDRCFHSGEQALMMSMRIDAPTPKVTVTGGGDPEMPKMPDSTRMVMDGDNLIRFTRRKAAAVTGSE